MRAFLLVVAAFVAPMLVIGIALTAGPRWLLWPAGVFAALLVLAVSEQWLTERKPPFGWLVPLALMIVAVLAVAVASPGATSWVLWPVFVAALVAVAAGLHDVVTRRPRSASKRPRRVTP